MESDEKDSMERDAEHEVCHRCGGDMVQEATDPRIFAVLPATRD
jgi:hypothetical protein